MTNITEQQQNDLIQRIFDAVISNPETGMGEMSEAREAAELIVSDWIRENDIIVTVK